MRHSDAAGSTSGKMIENGGLGRTCAVNLPIQSRMLWQIAATGRCGNAGIPACITLGKIGLINGTCTRTAAFTGPDATITL